MIMIGILIEVINQIEKVIVTKETIEDIEMATIEILPAMMIGEIVIGETQSVTTIDETVMIERIVIEMKREDQGQGPMKDATKRETSDQT